MMDKHIVRITSYLSTIAIITLGILYYVLHHAPVNALSPSADLTTYFSYSPGEIQALEQLNSEKVMTEAEVDQWTQIVFKLVKDNHSKDDATRLYAYFFAAQRDAAALSYQIKKKLSGSLSTVSQKTLCLLLPNTCASLPASEKPDAYSLKMAEMVTDKIRKRLEAEKKAMDEVTDSKVPQEWEKNKAYFGQKIGYQTPWFMKTSSQFRLPTPQSYDTNDIKNQKEELKTILSSVTKEQIEIANKWSAGSGTILTSGQWLNLANQYMAKHKTPLPQSILIRSILAMGVADATIACFDTKFTYWKQRPEMIFPDVKPNIKTPEEPSYPSGHATLSMAAAIIMDHYFPENLAVWNETAAEIAHSRLWGGIHFPVDEHDGVELGRKIGNWITKKLENQ